MKLNIMNVRVRRSCESFDTLLNNHTLRIKLCSRCTNAKKYYDEIDRYDSFNADNYMKRAISDFINYVYSEVHFLYNDFDCYTNNVDCIISIDIPPYLYTEAYADELEHEIYKCNKIVSYSNNYKDEWIDKNAWIDPMIRSIAEKHQKHIELAKENNQMKIKDVKFNNPATIVFWSDGTKTVVKADGEKFDKEKGLAMAITKKAYGNKGNYYNVFRKWIKEDIKDEKKKK